MSDHPSQPDRTLSEISHLFLSSVRERQTRGAARPLRRPPAATPVEQEVTARRPDRDVDLTPEEFAQVTAEPFADASPVTQPQSIEISALLAGHLGSQQLTRARQYAAHLAESGTRVGLIQIDASEFRIWCFERASETSVPPTAHENQSLDENLDARAMVESLHELAHDIDHWLLLMPSPRATEAQALLREIPRWILFASAGHDGIVEAYRTLKGLFQTRRRNHAVHPLPRLALALFDVPEPTEAARVTRKLAEVCEHFLEWPVEYAQVVTEARGVAENLVLACRSTRDKAQLAAAPQWQAVTDFLQHLKTTQRPTQHLAGASPSFAPAISPLLKPPQNPVEQAGGNGDDASQFARPCVEAAKDSAEVLDLPIGDATPQAIVSAVLRGGSNLVECPVHPPMCPEASLAVARDRRLVLVAVARQGLGDLHSIGQAYRWLIENRPLIAMAVPQFAIDAHQLPRLHLLVDHADMSAESLQPILQSGNVTVHAYRKLRWGGKMGLLLEAA